jgi:hypothetical protein
MLMVKKLATPKRYSQPLVPKQGYFDYISRVRAGAVNTSGIDGSPALLNVKTLEARARGASDAE